MKMGVQPRMPLTEKNNQSGKADRSGITSRDKSPFAIRNVRLFLAFRVFFNSRFYYPVFTILFLDFGLTLNQFALLNAAWAGSIVLLEVPSGALADAVGRKSLLVLTGMLMVVEIALLCIVPLGNTGVLFWVFLANRILSGAAEAAASGADEAIAYDTLVREGDARDWPRVLEKQMRIQSIAYIGAMSLGAAVYDPVLMQRIAEALGLHLHLTQKITLRFPLYLTLVMAVLTLLTTLKFEEDKPANRSRCLLPAAKSYRKSIFQALGLTLQAGKWILETPFALVIIFAGLIFDSCIRMVITLNSQYYRLIEVPEALFGLIGSAIAVLGLIIPKLAHHMVKRRSPTYNLAIMAVISFLGLVGMTFFLPIIGLIPVALLTSVMFMGRFFESHYLNRIAASHQRATVLSFKGLSFNLAYGLIGLLYSFLLSFLRPQITGSHPGLGTEGIETAVFIRSIGWFPWYFLLTLALLLVVARWQLQNSAIHKRPE